VIGLALVKAVWSRPGGRVGLSILLIVLAIAFVGPFVAPHSPNDTLTLPGALPSAAFPLGADFLGRDVLSRLLCGGVTVILMACAATILAYIVGVTVGVTAGDAGGWLDMILMRAVDIVLAFPPLMVLLLLVGGLDKHPWVLILGVVIVQVPGIARVTRAAALSASRSEFVEAARIRGDAASTILLRDVLANISSTVLADFGVRFSVSIVLIASMNYLGLGLTPPTADWGLMISENQNLLTLNPYSVVAPAAMLATITIGVNLVADAYMHSVHAGSSGRSTRRHAKPAARNALQPTSPPAAAPNGVSGAGS
jgi:peptide/nickel transport system permease protein